VLAFKIPAGCLRHCRRLLELFLELFELQTQAFNFSGERFDAVFETDDSLCFG
jgi:hypothetical protein